MLDKLEENYSLFESTGNEIVQLFKFPPEFYAICLTIFEKWKDDYEKLCERNGSDKYAQNTVLLQKDKDGNCFIVVKGNDGRTNIVIDKDNANKDSYKNISAFKISESKFAELLDIYQRKQLEKLNIPARFLKEEPDQLDLSLELEIDKLIKYYKYLNNEYFKNDLGVVSFDEPTDIVGSRTKLGISTAPRKNPVIDYEVRVQELLNYNPLYKCEFNGNKTGVEYDAFIYKKAGFVLAVVEPKSGKGYQYTLNLGPIDIKNIDLIKNNIKAALEASESIAMFDAAIMRKNHTTIDAFRENLRIFLGNSKSTKKYYYV